MTGDAERAVEEAQAAPGLELVGLHAHIGSQIFELDVYEKLAAPFEETHRDVRGGVQLEYITGEQCITRLNETLGVAGWSFREPRLFTEREQSVFIAIAEAVEAWVENPGEQSAAGAGA